MFLWNPYKNSEETKTPTEEPIVSALNLHTTTLPTLLNTTAVLISPTIYSVSIIGTVASGVNNNSNVGQPKALAYKQKRSSEKVVNSQDKPKTSFSPFFLPAMSNSNSEPLLKRNVILDRPVRNSVYKRSGSKVIQTSVDDQKGVRRRIRTLGLGDVKTETPFGKYKVIDQPFYLEDPFTTYAKGISRKPRFFVLGVLLQRF